MRGWAAGFARISGSLARSMAAMASCRAQAVRGDTLGLAMPPATHIRQARCFCMSSASYIRQTNCFAMFPASYICQTLRFAMWPASRRTSRSAMICAVLGLLRDRWLPWLRLSCFSLSVGLACCCSLAARMRAGTIFRTAAATHMCQPGVLQCFRQAPSDKH